MNGEDNAPSSNSDASSESTTSFSSSTISKVKSDVQSAEEHQDFPFDFVLKDDDVEDCVDNDDHSSNESENDNFSSPAESLNNSEVLPSVSLKNDASVISAVQIGQHIEVNDEPDAKCKMNPVLSTNIKQEDMNDIMHSDAKQSTDSTPIPESSQQTTVISHRGSLRRILNQQSFITAQHMQVHVQQQSQPNSPSSSCWPLYAITVDVDTAIPRKETTDRVQQYQILFTRQQHEYCTKLFILLDTECKASIGPQCIREFVLLHCPVVRRRDEAILAQREDSSGECTATNVIQSPTFDVIWDIVTQSDPRFKNKAVSPNNKSTQLGIEGWMIFCRLLALAHYQESQRRFASRHLQQMMRHKHSSGGYLGNSDYSPRGSRMVNPNEVVVVVDNPPPGPPALISVTTLMEVESAMSKGVGNVDEIIQGWPYCPLPLPELDLDHIFITSTGPRSYYTKKRVTIEPFSSSSDGDFVLRFHVDDGEVVVVRRSYSDFAWLNDILKLHKRRGHGNLFGRILPPFPPKQGLPSLLLPASRRAQKDATERALSVAKSGVSVVKSLAKSFWGIYVAPAGSVESSPSKSNTEQTRNKIKLPSTNAVHWSSSLRSDEDVSKEIACRLQRYLNYLLESQALSTSFPLNAILKVSLIIGQYFVCIKVGQHYYIWLLIRTMQASQSGLESAKQVLQEHNKQRKSRATNQNTSSSSKTSSAAAIWATLLSKKSSSYFNQRDDDDTSWLRTAARAAMSLQFHGILETTGHESTSAKIQHASLPRFGNQSKGSWDEDDTNGQPEQQQQIAEDSVACFEAGVVNIDSELESEDDIGGYDLLPSPGPSEEHRVLNAIDNHDRSPRSLQKSLQLSGLRFVYGVTEDTPDTNSTDVNLGSVKADNDVEKLKGIIKSVDHILHKLHESSMSIQTSCCDRNKIQLGLLRNIDSLSASRGEVISQSSLVSGVASLERYSWDIEKSNRILSSGMFVL